MYCSCSLCSQISGLCWVSPPYHYHYTVTTTVPEHVCPAGVALTARNLNKLVRDGVKKKKKGLESKIEAWGSNDLPTMDVSVGGRKENSFLASF